jgi:two-component sensor histidine kinase
MRVTDDGHGLPAGFDLNASDRLGLQIVRALVETELGGQLQLVPAAGGGTVATVEVTRR